jgi:hypothetical protein
MEELRKHTGELTEKQWEKLISLEYEIEGNANRLFVAIGCARELEREINYSQKRLEKLRAAVYAVESQTDRLERFYQNQVNRS